MSAGAEVHGYGETPIEVRVVNGPDGRPGVLLQLPDGFVIMNRPDQVQQLGQAMLRTATELRVAQLRG